MKSTSEMGTIERVVQSVEDGCNMRGPDDVAHRIRRIPDPTLADAILDR
jgi:hypothetical protein